MIVVDASVAAKWLIPEEHSDLAFDLLENCARRHERVVAPVLLPVEVTNILRQHVRRSALTDETARAALERFLHLPLELRPRAPSAQRELHLRALEIAREYELTATYDAHYLALAERLKCPLWTADGRLVLRVAGAPGVRVHRIADYQGESHPRPS